MGGFDVLRSNRSGLGNVVQDPLGILLTGVLAYYSPHLSAPSPRGKGGDGAAPGPPTGPPNLRTRQLGTGADDGRFSHVCRKGLANGKTKSK